MTSAYRWGIFFLALSGVAAQGCGDDDSNDKMTGDSPVTVADGGTGSDAGTGAGTADLPRLSGDNILPIVFVHGFAGSASQFESQAIRFAANGYPRDRIRAFDHNGEGLDQAVIAGFISGVDEYVNNAIRDFGVQKVYLVGHSRGTIVSSTYLGDPARAAKIAKYVSLDGSGCGAADMAGVPCIAPGQANQPGEKHVEVATSETSFGKMFQFFVGTAPTVTKIVKQNTPVQIEGRVVNFPANTGRAGTTLQFYEINATTGARLQAQPLASFSINDTGNWGPQTVDPDKHYELLLVAPDGGTQHFYGQRFLRNSHLIRLLSGGADSPARMNTNASDKHSGLTVQRMREWTIEDVLEIKETSKSGGEIAPVNVITPEVGMPMPTGMAGFVIYPIGLFIHDDKETPGMTTVKLLPFFSTQPFQSGVDVYLPAAEPTDGTITLTNYPRGDRTKPQVLNVPNWRSTNHFVTVVFADYPQE